MEKQEQCLPVASIKNIYQYLGENVTKGYRTGKTMDDNEEGYYIEECRTIMDYKLMTFGTKRLKD